MRFGVFFPTCHRDKRSFCLTPIAHRSHRPKGFPPYEPSGADGKDRADRYGGYIKGAREKTRAGNAA